MRLSYGMGFILLLVPCSLLVAFTHYPALKALLNSFWNNGSSFRPSRFVGVKNYEILLQDDKLGQVLINSFIYAIGTVPVAIALAIGMALLVNSKLPATGSTETSLASMMVVAVWKEAGLFMIFYLAALQSIPTNLKDAARLEGAGSVRIFFDVVMPLLRPTTIFVAVNALINAFRLVDHIVVMTRGGPSNSSSLLLYYIYEVTFGFRDFAYGATLTVLMVVILGFLAAVQFWVLNRKAHYQ